MSQTRDDTKLQHACGSEEKPSEAAWRHGHGGEQDTSDMDSAAQAHGPQIKLAAEPTVRKPLALSISDSDLELMK
jgi:hypothetical protein